MTNSLQKTILAGGCFWCLEAIFNQMKGIENAISGYIGGETEYPSYEDICTGNTGHAEAVQVTFDSQILTYDNVLELFFHMHDPTTLNFQGSDIGTQYRSAIFYHDDEQKKIAQEVIKRIDESSLWEDPIVTELTALTKFYEAEEYHQEYYVQNPEQPFCANVVGPKIYKFFKEYPRLLKD